MGSMIIATISIIGLMAATITILGKIVIKRGKTIFYLEKDILILKQTHASNLSRQKFDVSQRVRAEETNNLDQLLSEIDRSKHADLAGIEKKLNEKTAYINVDR